MPFKRHVSHGAGELSRSPRRWCEPSSRRRWIHVMRLLRWRKATCTCTLRWRKLACTWRRKPLVRRRRKSTHRSSLFKNDTASFSLDECVALEGRQERQGREGCLVCRCSVKDLRSRCPEQRSEPRMTDPILNLREFYLRKLLVLDLCTISAALLTSCFCERGPRMTHLKLRWTFVLIHLSTLEYSTS